MKYLAAFLAGGTAGLFIGAWALQLLFPEPAYRGMPRHDRIAWATSPAT